jgi:cytochrome c oxidase subunit 4
MADAHHAAETDQDFAKGADSPGMLVVVWLLVMALAATTVGISVFGGLGRLALPIQLFIACVQAGLVAYYFMHLRHGDKVVVLTALASIFWTAILFILFLVDYATRVMVFSW